MVDSATVDLIQVEKYQAEPDPTVWTFPIEQMSEDDDDDIASGSDDGFPETRTTGVSLKQAVALGPFGNHALSSHCREKVRPKRKFNLMLAFSTYQTCHKIISSSP